MMPSTLWRPEDVVWWRAESLGGGLACVHHHRTWDSAQRCRNAQQRQGRRSWMVRARVCDPNTGWQSLDPDVLEEGHTVALLFGCSWTHEPLTLPLVATWRAPMLGYAFQGPDGSTPVTLHPASAIRALRLTAARHLRRTAVCPHWHHHAPHPPWALRLTWFQVAAHAPREWARQYRTLKRRDGQVPDLTATTADWRHLGAALAEVLPADIDGVDLQPDGLTIHLRRPGGITEGDR